MTTTKDKHARYNASPKGRARTAKYRASAKGLLMYVADNARRRGTR